MTAEAAAAEQLVNRKGRQGWEERSESRENGGYKVVMSQKKLQARLYSP